MGEKSYKRKRPNWIKEKRLPSHAERSTTESSGVSSKIANRALEFCLVHQRPTQDGKWEVHPKKVETARVVQKVMENLGKEKENGQGSSSKGDNDALSKALGKRDYYGYIKGISRSSVGIGYTNAFGKEARSGTKDRDENYRH